MENFPCGVETEFLYIMRRTAHLRTIVTYNGRKECIYIFIECYRISVNTS